MRLIDADEYKGKCICNYLYSGVTELVEVDAVPTAFDLEGTIERIRDIPHGSVLNVELENEIIEILKSAVNATNGGKSESIRR